jgi:hypothetical protein
MSEPTEEEENRKRLLSQLEEAFVDQSKLLKQPFFERRRSKILKLRNGPVKALIDLMNPIMKPEIK